jgi:hypothetical protein
MSAGKASAWGLSGRDLDFLVAVAAPEVGDKSSLKKIIRQDDDFCRSFITDEKVFRRLMGDDKIILKISPLLFFEILLQNAAKELAGTSYTLEKTRTMSIPVFDSRRLVELLNQRPIVVYLAEMLASFTRVESYTLTINIGQGIWKKIRFNDMDIDSLIRFSEVLGEEQRLGLYKRIADICLFTLGMFPDFVEADYRYPFSGKIRPQVAGRVRMSPEEYERKGQQFYRLAADHRAASQAELAEVFRVLHENFEKAKKPLNFIAENYLRAKRHALFG